MSLLLALLGGGPANAPGSVLSYAYSVVGGAASATASAPGGAVTYSYSTDGGSATVTPMAPGAALSYMYLTTGGAATVTAQAPGSTLSFAYSVIGGAATAGQATENTPGIIRWRRWNPDEQTTKSPRHVDADIADDALAETTARIAATRRQIEKAQADLAVAVADADSAGDRLARSKSKAEGAYRARIEGRQAKASAEVEAIKIEIATLYQIEREAAARVAIFETDMAFVAAIMMEC